MFIWFTVFFFLTYTLIQFSNKLNSNFLKSNSKTYILEMSFISSFTSFISSFSICFRSDRAFPWATITQRTERNSSAAAIFIFVEILESVKYTDVDWECRSLISNLHLKLFLGRWCLWYTLSIPTSLYLYLKMLASRALFLTVWR